MEETPVAEVSTTEGHYGVEAMLDSGAGASVCSPNDFPTVAIDTKSEVTKVYRCADGRELRVYGYKRVRALVGKTQQILQIRFTVLDVLRPIIVLSCFVHGGWDLSFGGAPVEGTATHQGTRRRLGLIQRTGLYFIPLWIAVQQTQHHVEHVRGHVICSLKKTLLETPRGRNTHFMRVRNKSNRKLQR
eukprot:2718588-Amphidinium_carterae.2